MNPPRSPYPVNRQPRNTTARVDIGELRDQNQLRYALHHSSTTRYIREYTRVDRGVAEQDHPTNATYKDTYVRWTKDGECRLWTGIKRDGYPYVTVDDEQISMAAVIIRARIGGLIPTDRRVIRTCGNRACVNPEHLKLGTQSEAMKVAMADRERYGNYYLKKMAKEKKG